jgi:hypothetical protein
VQQILQSLFHSMKLKISCAVCHGDMGRGHATFTAECSHTFHLRCVNHRTACPLCHTSWRDVPGVTPTHALLFDDDEPLEMPPPHGNNQATTAAGGGMMVLKTHCQYPAVAKDATRDGFAVLVHAKAPALALEAAKAPRAPLDLVMVLDVSGSMMGPKIALLKQAMGFVIDKLGPDDRLSLVSFSSTARRLTRLARMSDAGRASSERAVESLVAHRRDQHQGGAPRSRQGHRRSPVQERRLRHHPPLRRPGQLHRALQCGRSRRLQRAPAVILGALRRRPLDAGPRVRLRQGP